MLNRLGLSITGFSIGIFFIAWQMSENHLAHPKNPAWQVVSALRTLLLILWTAASVIYGLLLLLEAIAHRRARHEKIKRSHQEEEFWKREQIANAKRDKAEERKQKEEEAKERVEQALKKQQEDERREKIRQEHIEKMKSRSPDEATNEALKDFF